VRTALGCPPGLQELDARACGLPVLPSISLVLYRAEAQPAPAVEQLARLLRQALPAQASGPPARASSRPRRRRQHAGAQKHPAQAQVAADQAAEQRAADLAGVLGRGGIAQHLAGRALRARGGG
jgi:hypothetical protein